MNLVLFVPEINIGTDSVGGHSNTTWKRREKNNSCTGLFGIFKKSINQAVPNKRAGRDLFSIFVSEQTQKSLCSARKIP